MNESSMRRCPCGSSPQISYAAETGGLWRGRCLDCGRQTGAVDKGRVPTEWNKLVEENELLTKGEVDISEKQIRMLQAGTFHFYSQRDHVDNLVMAYGLAALGFVDVVASELQQETVYNCTVTAAGKSYLDSLGNNLAPN
jgi:hypothetical protein